MVHNNLTPKIDVDPETCDVRADGVLLACESVTVLPLAKAPSCPDVPEVRIR